MNRIVAIFSISSLADLIGESILFLDSPIKSANDEGKLSSSPIKGRGGYSGRVPERFHA